MLDHLGLDVLDYERSKAFYERALAPLGIGLIMEPVPGVGALGIKGSRTSGSAGAGRPAQSGVHVAFAAPSRDLVDAFHAAALEAGATDNGGPGVRESITPTTTGRSCSTRMATTSRRSATRRPDGVPRGS